MVVMMEAAGLASIYPWPEYVSSCRGGYACAGRPTLEDSRLLVSAQRYHEVPDTCVKTAKVAGKLVAVQEGIMRRNTAVQRQMFMSVCTVVVLFAALAATPTVPLAGEAKVQRLVF